MTSKRVGALGLLIPQRSLAIFSNPFFSELLRGIGCVCDRHDFSILIVSPIEGSLTRALQRAAADGFVLVGIDERHPAFHHLQQRRVPCVTVSDPPVCDIPSVNVDDRGGAMDAARHLIELGHREVLTICLRPPHGEPVSEEQSSGFATSERLAGYRQAFSDADIPFREDLVVGAESTFEGGREAFLTAWRAGARPSGVLAMSDIMAIGVLSAAREAGLSVPDDLSIVGFDDVPAAQWCYPQLTTVHQSAIQIGTRAATMLIAHAVGDGTSHHVVLPTKLIVRGSTACASGNQGVGAEAGVRRVKIPRPSDRR
jgi:alanine racemase